MSLRGVSAVVKSTPASTPRLSEAARELVIPDGIVTSVFPLVERRLESVGVRFDPWQRGLGTIALGCRANGKYAASIGGVVASIPRQVGKTFTVGNLLIGLALEFPNMKIIWTSHHLRTTTATFQSMRGMVRKPGIAALLDTSSRSDGTRSANGEQEIRFANGSIIMFGARAMGFGRGVAAVDVLVFDEAGILGIKALEDMVPSTNQAQHPHGALIFFIGTPPRPSDPGEAFAAKRARALSGESKDQVYVEFSAEPGSDPNDRKQWPVMNPSYPSRTPLDSMLRMRENLPDEDAWRREAMGIWDSDDGGSAISKEMWDALGVEAAPEAVLKTFAVAFSADGSRVALAGARTIDEDRRVVHVELVGSHSGDIGSGVSSVADWLAERWRGTAQIVISGRSGAAALEQALKDRGVGRMVVILPTTPQYFAACAMTLDAVREGNVSHLATEGQAALDESVAVADRKVRAADGAWGWEATTPGGDETPIEAVSLALWAVKTTKRRPGRASRGVIL